MITFWALGIFFWTVISAFNVAYLILRRKIHHSVEKFYHLAWVIAFILAAMPLVGHGYYKSESDYWCWMGPDALAFKISCFWVPLDLCIIAVVVMYVVIQVQLRQMSDVARSNQRELDRAHRTLQAFPYPFVFLWFFPMINRYNNIRTSHQVFGLYILQAIADPILGFILVFLFLADGRILRKVKQALGCGSDPTRYNELDGGQVNNVDPEASDSNTDYNDIKLEDKP